MKRISFFFIFGAFVFFTTILLLFTSCEKTCTVKRPKDVKPINWENYNDGHTVFWNSYSSCSEAKNSGDNIMICGWIYTRWVETNGGISAERFSLVSNPNKAKNDLCEIPSVDIYTFNNDEVQLLLDTCDLAKKCFIIGVLNYDGIKAGLCCEAMPKIMLTDIYFE